MIGSNGHNQEEDGFESNWLKGTCVYFFILLLFMSSMLVIEGF